MSHQIALSTDQKLAIPQRLRSSYILWESGEDLRSTLPRTTFYRHRKDLLPYGIYIAIINETSTANNVVPLVRVLEAKPASIPRWAFTHNLIHHSARLAS